MRLTLSIPQGSQEERQQALRTLSALHTLSISEDRRDIYFFLTDNRMRLQDTANECEDETTLRWLQGAIQVLESLLKHIDDASENLHEIRKLM